MGLQLQNCVQRVAMATEVYNWNLGMVRQKLPQRGHLNFFALDLKERENSRRVREGGGRNRRALG